MERFVRLIVAGGVILVAGLWALRQWTTGSAPWLLGAALVVLGAGSLAAGIRSELSR